MKLSTSFCVFSAVFLSFGLPGCVTTRAELNAQKGITAQNAEEEGYEKPNSNSVKSEDLPQTQESAAPKNELAPIRKQTTPSTPAAAESGTPVPPQATAGKAAAVAAEGGSYGEEEMRAEMTRLNGRVEELEHEKKLNEDEHAGEKKKLQDEIDALKKQVQETQPKVAAVPEGKTPLEAAKDAYFSAKYEDAIPFLDQALKDGKGKDVEEATYLRGECNFKLKQYNKAIIDYSKFSDQYQKSAFHPKALLRIAESFEAMGQKDDANAFYSDLAEHFPKTAEGKLAKKRLKKK